MKWYKTHGEYGDIETSGNKKEDLLREKFKKKVKKQPVEDSDFQLRKYCSGTVQSNRTDKEGIPHDLNK